MLTINQYARKLSCGDNSVVLTQQELNMFLMIWDQAGNVAKKEDLYTLVSKAGARKTIDVVICKVRRKLKTLGEGAPSIETHHGGKIYGCVVGSNESWARGGYYIPASYFQQQSAI